MGKTRSAPSRQPLPDDVIPDILLRLRPDDPAGLVRATAVCKAWFLIITDPAFLGRYRALHPTAPVLGFLHNPSNRELPHFVSTTSFRAAAADNRRSLLDCGHGRAVFYDFSRVQCAVGCYAVWDPATGEHHIIRDMFSDEYLMHPTVFCDAVHDDHRGCSGRPFLVAFVGVDYDDEMDYDDDDETTDDDDDDDKDDDKDHYYDAHACLYASDTGKLTGEIDIHLGWGRYNLDLERPAALVGDSLYYLCWPGTILQYRYGLVRHLGIMDIFSAGIRSEDVLSTMDLPKWKRLGIGKNTDDVVVMAAEGGGLGLACLCPKTKGTMLYLLALETPEGAAGSQWVQRRVIDLKTLLPVSNNPKRKPCLRGLAQEANVIFVSTKDGVFSIDYGRSSSLQARKVCDKGVVVDRWMYPYVSFYTESLLLKLANSKLPAPVRNQ